MWRVGRSLNIMMRTRQYTRPFQLSSFSDIAVVNAMKYIPSSVCSVEQLALHVLVLA